MLRAAFRSCIYCDAVYLFDTRTYRSSMVCLEQFTNPYLTIKRGGLGIKWVATFAIPAFVSSRHHFGQLPKSECLHLQELLCGLPGLVSCLKILNILDDIVGTALHRFYTWLHFCHFYRVMLYIAWCLYRNCVRLSIVCHTPGLYYHG